jgi:tRNA threonylcarbamoyladenosine biosynthesis protein TsaE
MFTTWLLIWLHLCMEFRFSLKNIGETATTFWKLNPEAAVIAFHGQMGAGKTTFIHALCDSKGVKDVVGSPTFSIVNEYVFTENGKERKIFHIDLYRLRDEEEAIRAGIEDCLYSDHISLVEWPEKAPGIFPPESLHVFIEAIDTDNRLLKIANK